MASTKAIKTRIRSIENTRQITRAMELVAASGLKRALAELEQSLPYFTLLQDALSGIASHNRDFTSPFTRPGKGEGSCYIVIAGDRGLAGGYNHNLFRSVRLKEEDFVYPIGKKTVEYFAGRCIDAPVLPTAQISYEDCNEAAQRLTDQFLKGSFSRLFLCYTTFINALLQQPKTVPLLPVISKEPIDTRTATVYEPSAEQVFADIVPQYIAGMIYGGVRSSYACELSARRRAMESASENADEMLDKLRLSYNRARQAGITQELAEITSGTQQR